MPNTKMPTTDDWNNGPPAGRGGRVCGHCGLPVATGNEQTALVPDSSAMFPQDAVLDGQRMVTACGPEHVSVLVGQARRMWVDEQWWFGRLCRASVQPGMVGATVPRVAESARLSPQQLRAALAWNAERNIPQAVLPGGQPLPDQRRSQR
jgi:hypothetical protein